MSNKPTTLHFRAENFEATATRVAHDMALGLSHWIVEPRGERPSTLRLCGDVDETRWVNVLRDKWEQLFNLKRTDNEALALAISLLYSVPGVEVYERPGLTEQELVAYTGKQ